MLNWTALAALAASTLLAAPAAAHDVWLTLSNGATVPQVHLHYGHPDDLQRPQADKLVELKATSATGTQVLQTTLTPAPNAPVLVSEPLPGATSATLSARYDNGFWVKTPDGQYRNSTRRLVPGATEATTSLKFAKLIAGPGAPWAAPVGHDLEIVPLEDPLAVAPGGSLRVQVLFHGRPVAGTTVVHGDGETVVAQDKLPTVTTDASGVAVIPLAKGGGEVRSVARRVAPSTVPALADADLYSATLAFTLQSARTN